METLFKNALKPFLHCVYQLTLPFSTMKWAYIVLYCPYFHNTLAARLLHSSSMTKWTYRQLRVRRARPRFKDVPLRISIALSPYTVCSDSALLVLNGRYCKFCCKTHYLNFLSILRYVYVIKNLNITLTLILPHFPKYSCILCSDRWNSLRLRPLPEWGYL